MITPILLIVNVFATLIVCLVISLRYLDFPGNSYFFWDTAGSNYTSIHSEHRLNLGLYYPYFNAGKFRRGDGSTIGSKDRFYRLDNIHDSSMGFCRLL